MGFSTLVRICNLRHFFALGRLLKWRRSENRLGSVNLVDFSLAKLGFDLAAGHPE